MRRTTRSLCCVFAIFMVSSKDFTAGEKKKCMKTSVEKLKKRRRRRSVSFPGTEVVGERVERSLEGQNTTTNHKTLQHFGKSFVSCCPVLTIRATVIKPRNRDKQLAWLCPKCPPAPLRLKSEHPVSRLCNLQRNRGEQTSDQVILLGFKHWRYFLVAPVTSWNLLVIMRLPDNLQACV